MEAKTQSKLCDRVLKGTLLSAACQQRWKPVVENRFSETKDLKMKKDNKELCFCGIFNISKVVSMENLAAFRTLWITSSCKWHQESLVLNCALFGCLLINGIY